MTNKEILGISKILLESRAFNKKELDSLIQKLMIQASPAARLNIKELILNEAFHYVPLRHNKSLLDTDTFIEVFPLKECIPVCSISYDDKKVQIWLHKKDGIYYCNGKIIETTVNFSLTSNDHTEKSFLKTKLTNYPFFNNCIKAFQVGQVRFSNQVIKHTMYDVFRILGVR